MKITVEFANWDEWRTFIQNQDWEEYKHDKHRLPGIFGNGTQMIGGKRAAEVKGFGKYATPVDW